MFGMGLALEAESKNMVFCSVVVNAGHAGRPGPFGSPDLAKFTQYDCIRFEIAVSPGAGGPLKKLLGLANTKEISDA
jgi:hypothetical protein